ncbi:MAG TPA: pyridoxal-dependent decarboxylase [Saprospiraceae bacterium]|nr:pyridoxal-dependent decarboxylase [Saprospiraceae bacterium]
MTPTIFNNSDEGRAAFEELAQKVIHWISNYYASLENLPVRSQIEPGEVYEKFPAQFPIEPVSNDTIFKVLDEVILPGLTHWQHPNFYAFFPSNTSFPSIAAEMLTAGLAQQCMIWESSPAAAELEQRCMEGCRDLLGLPNFWEGAIQDTASSATLTALLTAREWKSGFRISKRGFDGTVFRIYASAQAHSSVEKAVRLAGFGTDNLVLVDTDEKLSLIPDKLNEAIQADLKQGFIPTCIISTLGTTATGAVDPIAAISEIANQYGIWHHVDAAYAGAALMLEEYAALREGFSGVDSFVFNPHKWMFVQFDCSLYYVRDPELLVRTMSINPSYLQTQYGDKVKDYRDWGIPLGRRFRALKLWMTLQLLGSEAIKMRLRHHIQLAKQVEQWIKDDTQLELVYPRSFNILTFRIKNDTDGMLLKMLASKINDSGKAYMTHAMVKNRGVLRWVIGQTYVEQRHIEDTWKLIQGLLQEIL